jgi:hypothetical protein
MVKSWESVIMIVLQLAGGTGSPSSQPKSRMIVVEGRAEKP